MSAVQLVAVDDVASLPLTREAWNGLLATSETNTVFQTYEWFASWCTVFAHHRPLFLLGTVGDRPVGIAPLARAGRVLRFAASRHGDYCDFIAGAEHKSDFIHAVLAFLAEHRADWDSLNLFNVPQRSSTLTLLRRHAPNLNLHVLLRGTVPCPTIMLGACPDPARTLLRKESLQRAYNHFARGALKFRHVREIQAAMELLPLFFQQHIDRWRAARTPSLFEDADNRRFYQAMVQQMLPAGWLALSVVEYNGAPIAFHLGFDYDNAFLWYKPSFDIGLAKHSPGNVMLRCLLEYCIESGKSEFDFTIGDEPFKRRYANATRRNQNIQLTSDVHSFALARTAVGIKRWLRPLWKARA